MPAVTINLELCGQQWQGAVYGVRGGTPSIRANSLTEALAAVKEAALKYGPPMPSAPIKPVEMPSPIDEERLAQTKRNFRKPATKVAEPVPPPRPAEPRAPRGSRGPRQGERALSRQETKEALQAVSPSLAGRA